jgi:hypothetical protein
MMFLGIVSVLQLSRLPFYTQSARLFQFHVRLVQRFQHDTTQPVRVNAVRPTCLDCHADATGSIS